MRARTSMRPPSGVNFSALDSRFSSTCFTLRSSARIVAEVLVDRARERDLAPRCARSRSSIIVLSMAVGKSKSLEVQLHAPGLDLRQVEDVVDQREQVPPRVQDVGEILRLLVVDLAEHLLGQDFREADDGVERRAQLVRHVGQELALVLARHLELPALVLDLAEQPRVLDGQRRLRREGLEQLDHLRRELAGGVPVDGQAAEQLVLAQQRNRQQRPTAQTDEDVANAALVARDRPRCRGPAPARRVTAIRPSAPSPLRMGDRAQRRDQFVG